MTPSAARLLSDLGKLLAKYGPEPFIEINQYISRGELAEALQRALTSLEVLAATTQRELPASRESFRKRQRPLDSKDKSAIENDKETVLVRASKRLRNIATWTSWADMEAIARFNSIDLGGARTRERAIVVILDALRTWDAKAVRDFINKLPHKKKKPPSHRSGATGLAQWSEIILDRPKDK